MQNLQNKQKAIYRIHYLQKHMINNFFILTTVTASILYFVHSNLNNLLL